ncbi:5-methylthioadenosine/S-adenosylhomocysteine deaminase [Novosphingobium endophyticum]|uniref:5-methylthioadenosine/S-adenosylhomocysteine deaminase n=2 Tax=Novosphingobium endophyticum TaxID=1955250 RepID=A0A916X6W6_9SPHN|nr:5-methylthioadenosine/S-adenosylhomocysteine deaminase [Novosphingobium endophyticum]
MTAKPIELLVQGATVITMDRERRIFLDGALAVDAGRIVGVGPRGEVAEQFSARRTIDGRDLIVTPGFINGHVHITGDPLTRGFMPDTIDYRDSEAFLHWVLPRYLSHTAQDEHVSAKLAALEMLRCGITCFLEAGTIRHIDEAAAGLTELGIRARIGLWTEGRGAGDDVGSVQASDAAIAAMEAAVTAYPPDENARIAVWPLLVGHNTNSDAVWQAAKAIADARNLGVSAHMSPYLSDTEWYLENTGCRPIEHLARLGVLGDNVTLTHLAHLADVEAELLIQSGVNVVYCPLAALKGAFGVARSGRYPELAAAGINLLLGTDGYDCDIMRLMPMASGTFKDAREDLSVFPAHQMLEMITINGARALGLADEIGSIEPGKRADFVCHDANRPELRPLLNPVNQLVWSADGRGVRSVWVDGECLIDNYRSTRIDEDALFREAQAAGDALVARTGLHLQSPWPIIR